MYNMIIYRLIVKIKLRKLKIITKNLFYFYLLLVDVTKMARHQFKISYEYF